MTSRVACRDSKTRLDDGLPLSSALVASSKSRMRGAVGNRARDQEPLALAFREVEAPRYDRVAGFEEVARGQAGGFPGIVNSPPPPSRKANASGSLIAREIANRPRICSLTKRQRSKPDAGRRQSESRIPARPRGCVIAHRSAHSPRDQIKCYGPAAAWSDGAMPTWPGGGRFPDSIQRRSFRGLPGAPGRAA